jgi:phage-related holin
MVAIVVFRDRLLNSTRAIESTSSLILFYVALEHSRFFKCLRATLTIYQSGMTVLKIAIGNRVESC